MAREIGFVETFALAQDRGKTLAELIPGSEEFYYYSCLHAEQCEAPRAELERLVAAWIDRHGTTQRVREIQNRLALIHFESEGRAAAEHLRLQLGLDFDHQRETEPSEVSYPKRLDPASITRDALAPQAFAESRDDLRGFTDDALYWLASRELTPGQRRALLSRVNEPDLPNLVELVLADLDWRASSGFGSHSIHRRLTLAQLDELARRRPALLADSTFVDTRLLRLRPSPEVDIETVSPARTAYLRSLWDAVRDLSPSFNSLKAHVLYHLLLDEHRRGVHDRELLLTYLALPRQVSYGDRRYLEQRQHRDHPATLGSSFASTGLGVVGNDEPLVRELLAVFLEDAADTREFSPFLDERWLSRLFATTKLLAGVGDRERWYSRLDDPSFLAELKERVDLDLCATNPELLRGDAPVCIDVFVKNVAKLVIKVFELDVARYFLARGADIDTAIDLDGLVAADERTVTFDEPPLRRVLRHFEFPSLGRAGVFVVELIGGGRSSRALIKKGALRFHETPCPLGHLFHVYGEDGRLLENASLSFGGRDYTADAQGRILVPFSTAPARQAILLRHGDLSSVGHFQHVAETLTFSAGLYVERESLVANTRALLLIRPQLSVSGTPVGVERIESPSLTIEATDHRGTTTTRIVPDLELDGAGETAVPFTVPEELATITFTVRARVRSRTEARLIDVSDTRSFAVSGIERSAAVADLHLSHTDQGYTLSYLGKTGEPRPGTALNVILKLRGFVRSFEVTLSTDESGEVALGALVDVETVTARAPSGIQQTWPLSEGGCIYGKQIHVAASEELRVPFLGAQLTADRVGLFELREGAPLRDCFGLIRLEPAELVVRGLAPGDYELYLRHERVTLEIRVSSGTASQGWLLGPRRFLESCRSRRLAITSLELQHGELVIRLGGAGAKTRVHVLGTRFCGAYDALSILGRQPTPARVARQAAARCQYVSGRDIGDEMRYVLERRFSPRYAGVLLERPSLLIQPRAVATTETDIVDARAGAAYAPSPAMACAAPAPRRDGVSYSSMELSLGGVAFTSLEFLPTGAAVLPNLLPDSAGVIRVPLANLPGARSVRVVAVDDLATVVRELGLPKAPLVPRDLRLAARALDPESHFVERREISALEAGETLTLEDASTARHQTVDTVGRAFAYLRALSGIAELDQFEWLTRWPLLSEEERREKLREYGCHEVSFFLAKKDPVWFAESVRPLIEVKAEPLFLDDYLCGRNLRPYAEPWRYSHLNTLERILLAEQIDGERESTLRRIVELCELIPPDPEADERRFSAGLAGGALDEEPVAPSPQPAPSGGMAPGAAGALRAALAPGAPLGGPPRPSAASASETRKKRAQKGGSPQPLQRGGDDQDREGFGALELAEAEEPRFLYQSAERTREWAETHYYGLRRSEIDARLVPASPFWRDYAGRDRHRPFVSPHLGHAVSTAAECLLALAVLDLPFGGETTNVTGVGAGLAVTARTPQLVFHRQIRPAAPLEESSPVLVGQSYLRDDDRVIHDGAETIDKLAHEFLVHTTYVCRTTLTNPTSSRQKLDLLLQIPAGTLPAKDGSVTRGLHVRVEPFATESLEYAFYFPAPGTFGHFPVHVAKSEALVAAAPPTHLTALAAPTTIDTTSWAHVSQRGNENEVLRHLETNNLGRLDLDRIAWRMKRRAFFERTLELLRSRRVFSPTLWSYSLLHRDTARLREYLAERPDFLRRAGLDLRSAVAVIDARCEAWLEHLEYAPLINARAHRLGAKRTIANRRFAEQYRHFLSVLAYRRLDDADRLAVAYYLLLQDRFDEGIAFFRRVDPARVAARLQYDYIGAWIALLEEKPDEARRFAEPHRDHPSLRWRLRFRSLLTHLDELAHHGAATAVDPNSVTERQARLAATEPSLDVAVSPTTRTITITSRNLSECRVAYYPMDVELLFSRQPFGLEKVGQLSYIRPARSDTHPIPNGGRLVVAVPSELGSSNVVVEVSAAGLRVSQTCFAAALAVQVVENYGQVCVTEADTDRPLPRTYVKTYARQSGGAVRFYKDGYTDLAGRFDYATLSTDELDRVERFAILVLHETRGAVTREAGVPQR